MWRLDFETVYGTREIVCVQWNAGPRQPVWIANEPDKIRQVVAQALDVGFWAHFAAFEALCIRDLFGLSNADIIALYDAGKIVCSREAAKLYDIRNVGELLRPYGLGALTGKDAEDPWRKRYGELRGVPLERWPAEALAYCAGDIEHMDSVLEWAEPRNAAEWGCLRRASVNRYWLEVVANPGPPIDAERVERIVRELSSECAELMSGMPDFFEPRSKKDPTPKRKMDAIKAHAASVGMTERTAPTAKFPNGQLRLSEDVLRETDDLKLSCYREWLGRVAVRDRLDTKYRGPFIATRYEMLATGRYASSAPDGERGDNLTTMPRKSPMRNVLYAPPGKLWAICDFSQLEVATFADILQRKFPPSQLCALLRDGKDFHRVTAGNLLGRDYHELSIAYEAEEAAGLGGPVSDARQMCKVPNFGGPGFMGAKALQSSAWADYGMRLSLDQCRALLNAWRAVDPVAIASFFAEAQAAMHTGGLVTLPDGFVRKCDRVGNFCNTQFQGWGARISTEAGKRVVAAGFDVRFFAHDELGVLIDDDEHATENAFAIAEIMESSGRDNLAPDGPPLRVAPILARRMDKRAKSKLVDGRLTVWDQP